MSIPVLPESAPFSPSQRAWLNGFFAGLFGLDAPSSSIQIPATLPVEAIVEEDFPWHDAALPLDERMQLAVDRKPERKLMAAMAQLDCGSCGYLCQTYAEAIATGSEKDLTKCTPGGKDTSKKLKELFTTLQFSGASILTTAPTAKSTGNTLKITRESPAPIRVLRVKKLNTDQSEKDTRHIEFDLRNTGLTYKVGDALGIWPENDVQLVEHILNRLNCTGAEDVSSLDGTHTSLYQSLRQQRVITAPTGPLIELLITLSQEHSEKLYLQNALIDDGSYAFSGLHVLDLLQLAPSAQPTPQQFADALGNMQPRLYSISSSPFAHENQVHLTVGAVRYKNTIGRMIHGVGSTYLSDRIRPGEQVRAFIHTSKYFGLPEHNNRPIIMIGPGTGIAPFRAFLHHRKASGAKGKNWLFFGDQTSANDFLYRDELEQFQSDGHLNRLDTAFSRDQSQKVYVQNRMTQNGQEFWKWLEEGAGVYVCGDAGRMARDVDIALHQLIQTHGQLSEDNAKLFVKDLAKAGRYQRDVY